MLTSRDYFDLFEFSKELTPEMSRRQSMLIDLLEKNVHEENIIDEICSAASFCAVEAQYTGFMQGIRLACALFCESDQHL